MDVEIVTPAIWELETWGQVSIRLLLHGLIGVTFLWLFSWVFINIYGKLRKRYRIYVKFKRYAANRQRRADRERRAVKIRAMRDAALARENGVL